MDNPLLYVSPPDYGVHVDQEIYQALIYASQSLPLIPSIKKLVWDNSSETFKYLKSLFISPTLTMLHLWLTDGNGSCDVSLFSLLTSLPLLCPTLSTLGLSANIDDRRKNEISMRISAIIPAFRNLMHLQWLELPLSGMPETALCNLITLNRLRSLHIHHIHNIPSPSDFQHPMPEDRRNPLFPCLEHLKMRGCTIEFILWMFANMWEAPLKTLIFEFGERPTVTNWMTLLKTIYDQISHHCLRVIDTDFDPFVDDATDPGLTLKELSPLLSFTKLTRVSLCVRIALDDDAMTRIALAWPHLELLYLRDQPLGSSQSVTFTGLVNLARNCQVLKDLCLPSIDATKMLPDALDLDSIACNRKLEVLNVQNSLIDDPSLVAPLLSALFPNLRYIYAEEFNDKWTQVMETIRRNRDVLDAGSKRD